MKLNYILPFLAIFVVNQTHAEDFGYLTKNDELYCKVDGIFPKENADKDGCIFFRYDKDINHTGYATTKGKIIIPSIYRTLLDTRQNPNYLIATKYINEDKGKADESKGKYGMLDKAKTQDFISFAVNNKYGIMGDKGNVIVEPHYTYEEILGIVKKLKAK